MYRSQDISNPIVHQSEPLVSVVIPNFNHAQFLPRCIRSLINQTYKNLEIVGVDGASSDNSVEIFTEFSKHDSRIRFISEKDEGQSDAINKGLSMSHGKFGTWLNSDDMLEPNAISECVNVFLERPECVLAYGSVLDIDLDGHIIKLNKGLHLPAEELSKVDFIPQTGALFRLSKEVRLNPQLKWALDWDLWIRLSKMGSIHCLNTILGRCIVEGIPNRKSDMQIPIRTMELVSVQRKYCKKLNSHIIAGWLAAEIGIVLSPFFNKFPNLYVLLLKIIGRIHRHLTSYRHGIML